jgi:hypothetical protein
MISQAMAYPGSVVADAARNLGDATNLSVKGSIVTGLVVGVAMAFAPHLLAVNGAIALFGSLGRAASGHEFSADGKKQIIDGVAYNVICHQTGQEFLDDPLND